jgi:hypothetical protein
MPLPSPTKPPSNSAPAGGLASQSQVSKQLQFPTISQSQSHLQSLQEKQQPQPVCIWSAHTPIIGQWPSPFPRYYYALSTTATSAGELFLFGGYSDSSKSLSNDLYVISTRNFSTTLLKTTGAIPSPRRSHCAVLTSTTTLLVWGGLTIIDARYQSNDDSIYLLDLGTSELFDVKTGSSLSEFLASQYRESGPAS